ncbi:hypothetical protein ScPMuIL_009878 [Solemya velum]
MVVIRHISRLSFLLPACRRSLCQRQFVNTSCLPVSSSCQKHGAIAVSSQGPIRQSPPTTWCVLRGYAKKAKKEKVVKGKKGHVSLTEDEIGDVLDFEAVKSKMQQALDSLKEEYIHNLTLRTSTGVFDSLQIDTADGSFPLNQLGQIIQKNPHLLLINLTATPQYIPPVMEAITASGLNVNPQQEGSTIFIPIPKVTREHRENLAKSAKMLCDKTKTKVRDIHTKAVKEVRGAKDTHSEDLIRNLQEMIVEVMHECSGKADKMLETKKQELLGDK